MFQKSFLTHFYKRGGDYYRDRSSGDYNREHRSNDYNRDRGGGDFHREGGNSYYSQQKPRGDYHRNDYQQRNDYKGGHRKNYAGGKFQRKFDKFDRNQNNNPNSKKDHLFRTNVGAVIVNNQQQVLWVRRTGTDFWQFPQGGCLKTETPSQALFREVNEEVGIEKDQMRILAESYRWFYYIFPKNALNKKQADMEDDVEDEEEEIPQNITNQNLDPFDMSKSSYGNSYQPQGWKQPQPWNQPQGWKIHSSFRSKPQRKETPKQHFVGQKQRWFLTLLLDDAENISLRKALSKEFDDWKWVNYWYPIEQIAQFKRQIYRNVLVEFSSVVFKKKNEESF